VYADETVDQKQQNDVRSLLRKYKEVFSNGCRRWSLWSIC